MIRVHLKERSYPIYVGRDILSTLGRHCAAADAGSDALCVTNAYIRAKSGTVIRDSLAAAGMRCAFFTVPDGEKSKSFAECRRLLERLAGMDGGKRIFVVAAGGGVIGDLAGFCAAVYKRGIPYVQVPTTLLAQVDSSIGGKTAIDLAQGKNLIGAFYQPRLVLSDVGLLSSLDRRQFASGMAEAVKYGVIKDPRLFALIERGTGSLGPRSRELESVVSACSRIKASVVEQDERDDKGRRIILNFGHTIGHAAEAAAGFGGCTHGEAVAFGMACACDISREMGYLGAETARRIERVIAGLGLPVTLPRMPFAAIQGPYLRDKKFRGKSRFVLLRKIGSPVIVEDVPLALVRKVVARRSV